MRTQYICRIQTFTFAVVTGTFSLVQGTDIPVRNTAPYNAHLH